MEPSRKRNQGNSPRSYYGPPTSYGSYGYGHGYGYGYGYPGHGSGTDNTLVQKTLQDHLLIVRERVWYIVVAFLVVLGTVCTYTFTRVPRYTAEATLEVFHRTPTVLRTDQAMEAQISSAEDLNTQVNILKSHAIAQNVSERLRGDLRQQFLAPYIQPGKPPPMVADILWAHRLVLPQRLSYLVSIQYDHADKSVAAAVANLFADEYISYNEKLRVSQSMEAVDELRLRADAQRRRVDTIAASIQAYREKNNLVSLDQRKDIVTEALKDLNKEVTDSSSALQAAETDWMEVQQFQRAGRSCLDLPFVASIPAVSKLQEEVSDRKIQVAQLTQKYRAKHPQMIAAASALRAAEQQLEQTIETVTAQVQNRYETSLQNYRKAQAALSAQETGSLRLDRYGLEYSNLERDYLENEHILDQILASQLREQQASSGTLENELARIVDRAIPPQNPSSPRYTLNLGLGVVGGLVIGLALAFFVAYNDDRIKSASDIEGIVGLPLVGIIPRLRSSGSSPDGRPAAGSEEASQIQESFSSIRSALQLKDESKRAQCILVTSTVAGEGKTFISTGLAETYAAHGERVLIVDCDLRRPAVNRAFRLENLKGVIDVCSGTATVDEVTIKGVRPNLDVIPTGGRSKNPSQLLNSKEFAQMISDFRKRYDRIFVDTPPAGIVSDAFVILPMVDGSLYSIFFDKVRRKAAQFCAQRLLEVNVPHFGAVLNGISAGQGQNYYGHYYNPSYKDYVDGSSKNGNPSNSPPTEAR